MKSINLYKWSELESNTADKVARSIAMTGDMLAAVNAGLKKSVNECMDNNGDISVSAIFTGNNFEIFVVIDKPSIMGMLYRSDLLEDLECVSRESINTLVQVLNIDTDLFIKASITASGDTTITHNIGKFLRDSLNSYNLTITNEIDNYITDIDETLTFQLSCYMTILQTNAWAVAYDSLGEVFTETGAMVTVKGNNHDEKSYSYTRTHYYDQHNTCTSCNALIDPLQGV